MSYHRRALLFFVCLGLLQVRPSEAFLDLITAGAVGGAAIVLHYAKLGFKGIFGYANFGVHQVMSRFGEMCDERWIKPNMSATSIFGVNLLCTPECQALGLELGGFLAGAAGALYGGYKYVTGGEKCDGDTWHSDVSDKLAGLASDLDRYLHGQHLVKNAVMQSLRSHLSNQNPEKPLVLSFHGWTGGGKNFVSQMIVNNIYVNKGSSKFVHWFIGNVHFPHSHKLDEYKNQLISWIVGNVSHCGYSTFIFDEVDKMPIGLMDSVKPFMDYYERIHGTDFRKCIFILLSNTGGTTITEKTLQHWEEGKDREDLVMGDFEELIEKGAFNEKIQEKGGWFHASMIEKNLVDYYIPFLPLQREHVKLCVADELRRNQADPRNETLLDEVADKMPYFPESTKLFSRVGCKRIQSKVNEYVYRYTYNL